MPSKTKQSTPDKNVKLNLNSDGLIWALFGA
jgi:hypothetical protein